MTLRNSIFAALAILAAAVCVRLGVWQLDRLSDRRSFNEQLAARAEMAPVGLSELPADTAEARFRRVRVTGTYDFEREIVIANRVRNGSPGVNIITPVMTGAGDSAVLVNRGWVYAPDGMTVDLAKWREPPDVQADAYVATFRHGEGNAKLATAPGAYRWMDRPALSQAFPYAIAPYYLVLIGETTNPPAGVPPRVPVPPMDEGSHMSYALQWFSFASVSIIGLILFLRRK